MAFGATLAAAVLWAAAPAVAREELYSSSLSVTGSVTASWHGDRARGCAAAGLCEYHGSSTVRPGSYGAIEFITRGTRVVDAFGYASFDESPVVRVLRGEEAACVDSVADEELRVSVLGRPGGHTRIALDFGPTLGRGVCAGPELSAVVGKAFGRTVSLARLRRGDLTLAFPGRRPYVSGRFAGALRSSIKLHIGKLQREHQDGGSGDPQTVSKVAAGSARFVRVRADYRVTGLSGKMTTTIGGLAGPPCAGFDACGAVGSSSWALLTAGGRLHVEGYARARAGDHGLADALAAIRRSRSGLWSSYGTVTHGLGATSALVSWPGGRTCRDSEPVAAPDFSFSGTRRAIPISLGGEEAYEGAGDFVRAGCPGPAATEVLGAASIADGSLPPGALRARRVTVPLRAGAGFHERAYAGSRHARFALGLRRQSLQVTYRTVRR